LTAVTITTQLSTFNLIRNILRNNSTISTKFSVSDFFEFEENLKAVKTKIPHIFFNHFKPPLKKNKKNNF